MEKEFKLIIKKGVTKKDPIVVITSHPVGEPSGCEERIERKLSLRGAEFTELSLPRVKRGGGNPHTTMVDCHARSSLAMTATVSKLLAMTEGHRQLFPREGDSLYLINFVEGFAVLKFLTKKSPRITSRT